jgi:hypothetical protein
MAMDAKKRRENRINTHDAEATPIPRNWINMER